VLYFCIRLQAHLDSQGNAIKRPMLTSIRSISGSPGARHLRLERGQVGPSWLTQSGRGDPM